MNWEVVTPLLVFLLIVFFVGIWSNRKMAKSDSFLSDYFLGSREFGGIVLAMTMVATYGSASSFLGGPGAAYSIGFGWVLLAMTQVATGYFVLLVLGKKFAIVTRKFQAVTLIDFLKERYKSKAVVLLSAGSIIVFLFSAMAAQWVGGAYLIQSLTGLSYTAALFIFTLSVLIYVTIGGFRAVAITDTIQGFVMVVGTFILLIAVVVSGGGISALFADLASENPNLITPYGQDGQLTALYISSYWILVGVGVVALPQVAVRAMSYRNAKSMHRAILIGTVVVGVIMLNMHLIGVFARPIMPGIEVADQVIPMIALEVLPPWIAGIVLAAPLAAMMSTVDSLLLLVSSSVVKDVYMNYIKPTASDKQMKNISMGFTGLLGIVAFLLAIQPPELLIFLNLFAFGGLEAAFIWPLVMGLYWKYANKQGAIASMIVGIGTYIVIHFYNQAYGDLLGVHTVTLPVILSFIAFIVFSLLFKKEAYEFPATSLKNA
ncbi:MULTISPECIES: sodium/pantothenate symporter [Virgibacillus]|uniref:Sodium/panthothenate symporter n=1 Tax=Virgibacillus kapii TaxID=1638645 RepID=A0ABQ2D2P0_9BACI|nr:MULTISPECIES: sodium/pantothenate symporter [Virgibacillus]EQB36660.1 sodium:pantothenate symporter [Virgibacillus sp. CM-4]MYL42494.1 sodium/panthothenate symporter [Virgibacillus massiliensis]GGJ41964.1 sodium/panthothenate symporter [Virgibacillus kapii]